MARRTVKEVSVDLDKLIAECDLVEKKIHSLEMKLALLEQKTANIEKDVASVFGYSSWASKVFVGVLITGAAGFIIQGGLL